MAVKPSGKTLTIREQIIEDPTTGLTFQFKVHPNSDAPYRLCIFGDLPYGNREILFDADGNEAGAGTATTGTCPTSWLREVS